MNETNLPEVTFTTVYLPILISIAIGLFKFCVAAAAVWLSIMFLNRSAGISFRMAYAKITEIPIALAIYHGLQLLAAAILYGAVR